MLGGGAGGRIEMTRFSLDYGGGVGVPAARSSGDPKTVRATASIILCFLCCSFVASGVHALASAAENMDIASLL
jgi:hypothetical protein